jgi:hypothetical protein
MGAIADQVKTAKKPHNQAMVGQSLVCLFVSGCACEVSGTLVT